MRTVDKLTDQDAVSQIQTVHHNTKATTVLSEILSNDHTQANLSEQFKETEPTLPVTTQIHLLRCEKLYRIDMTPLVYLSGMLFMAVLIETSPTSHPLRDRLCRTCMSPPMALTGTMAPPLVEHTGASMILMLTLVKRDGMEYSALTITSLVLPWSGAT